MSDNDPRLVCSREAKPWRGEAFWQKVDKLAAILNHPAYWYVSVGLLLLGTILGVIAPYFK